MLVLLRQLNFLTAFCRCQGFSSIRIQARTLRFEDAPAVGQHAPRRIVVSHSLGVSHVSVSTKPSPAYQAGSFKRCAAERRGTTKNPLSTFAAAFTGRPRSLPGAHARLQDCQHLVVQQTIRCQYRGLPQRQRIAAAVCHTPARFSHQHLTCSKVPR